MDKVIDLAKQSNVPIHVYNDVNHSLEGDDTLQNISILEQVMKEIYAFL